MGHAKRVDTTLVVRITPDRVTQALGALSPGAQWLLTAYLHFERLHGSPAGYPGVCWPTDTDVAAHLGRTVASVRRSRAALVAARFAALRYVPPYGRLPNGELSANGTNVIMLMQSGVPGEAALVSGLVDATTELRRLEAAVTTSAVELLRARKDVESLKARLFALCTGLADNDPRLRSISIRRIAPPDRSRVA